MARKKYFIFKDNIYFFPSRCYFARVIQGWIILFGKDFKNTCKSYKYLVKNKI